MYSIMEYPMTSCGCFECIMMIMPLCNGFMVVSREDPSMTPAGMTFSTLAGMAGGGLQTPGRDGHRQVLYHQQKVHPRRWRPEAHRLDVQLPERDAWPRNSRKPPSAPATPT